jgi:hypothetical protein
MDVVKHMKEDSGLSREGVLRLLQEVKDLRREVESLQKERLYSTLLAAVATNATPPPPTTRMKMKTR